MLKVSEKSKCVRKYVKSKNMFDILGKKTHVSGALHRRNMFYLLLG